MKVQPYLPPLPDATSASWRGDPAIGRDAWRKVPRAILRERHYDAAHAREILAITPVAAAGS